jgi:hypothetical protein
MGKVFIVQEIVKRDSKGNLNRVHDLTPAAVYGQLTILLGGGKLPLIPQPIVQELKRKLQGFSDEDHILAVGDPVAIGIATAVAAEINHGRVSMLKWDREARQYIQVAFDLRNFRKGE